MPTFRDLGDPSIVGETWYAVFAPVGTPRAVVDRLNAALRKITSTASFGESMRKIGNEAPCGGWCIVSGPPQRPGAKAAGAYDGR